MKVWVDPDDGNQVMAIYSHETDTDEWEDRGYNLVDVPPRHRSEVSRDHRVSVSNGEVDGVTMNENPVQPSGGGAETFEEKVRDVLRAEGLI